MPAAWDREYVERFWEALDWTDSVLEEFSGWFKGKTSPVHLFWHGLDLAVTRFSGRTAPTHPGGVPGLPDSVTRARERGRDRLVQTGNARLGWLVQPCLQERTFDSTWSMVRVMSFGREVRLAALNTAGQASNGTLNLRRRTCHARKHAVKKEEILAKLQSGELTVDAIANGTSNGITVSLNIGT